MNPTGHEALAGTAGRLSDGGANREAQDESRGGVDDLLTVEAAAKCLGIGRTKMYGLLSSGEVESITIGTRRLVPPECLAEFVQRRREQSRRRPSITAA